VIVFCESGGKFSILPKFVFFAYSTTCILKTAVNALIPRVLIVSDNMYYVNSLNFSEIFGMISGGYKFFHVFFQSFAFLTGGARALNQHVFRVKVE